ncbi:MAG TPA: enoyl-CoA hydratase/isomerase family protein [Micropepsaceae bacterium]|nr:enoyl-CoA hydratase/isomerase family protein [Micropepsaceae bacterium]
MKSGVIKLKRDGDIATVRIARAERRNAITNEMMEDIETISRGFLKDAATRVVIFAADGTDFSIGADLSQPRFQSTDQDSLLIRRRTIGLGGRMLRAIQEIEQPTLAAVQGIATGGGACIATACDFRIAADNARMGYGEVKIGINLMWHALPICVHLVGPSRAKQLVMSGKLFPAATLAQWGFVDEVVPLADLAARTRSWAEEYAALPPIAVQMIKRSINKISGALDGAIMHMDVDQWLLATTSDDFKEAVSAFFEKRKPVFKGN